MDGISVKPVTGYRLFLELKNAQSSFLGRIDMSALAGAPSTWNGRLRSMRIVFSYSVDAHALRRKAKVDGDNKTASVGVAPADELQYRFAVVLDPHGVQIKGKDNAILDDFRSDGVDWTRARITIRGGAYFDVRR